MEVTYILAVGGLNEAREESASRSRLAGVGGISHHDAVVHGPEVKFQYITNVGLDIIGREGEAILADIDANILRGRGTSSKGEERLCNSSEMQYCGWRF